MHSNDSVSSETLVNKSDSETGSQKDALENDSIAIVNIDVNVSVPETVKMSFKSEGQIKNDLAVVMHKSE